MSVKKSRIVFGTAFLIGLIAVFVVPRICDRLTFQATHVAFFGLITLDWIWLRLVKPK